MWSGIRSLWVLCGLAALMGCGSDVHPVVPADAGGEDAGSDADVDAGRDAAVPQPRLAFERVPLALEVTTETGHHTVTTFAFIPDTNELLLIELHGDVYHYEVVDGEGVLLGHFDLSEHVYPDAPTFHGDCGLISLVFDPAFDDNGLFYAGVCFSDSETGILRLTFDREDYDGIVDSAAVIMREERQNSPSIHNVGQMGFDQDGYLWALYGERGVSALAADRENNFGAMVRIEPNRQPDGEGYEPAPGNPFIDDEDGLSKDIYAYGFRSPWTGHYDSLGRWWIGDVGSGGSAAVEEVNVLTEPASNFGWPAAEGPCEGACEGLIDPVRHWNHSSAHPYIGEMERPYPSGNRVAWVGVEYRDHGEDPYEGLLTHRVLYGEMCVGFVRAIELDATGEVLFDALVGEMPKISAWGQGADGSLYVTTYGACEARRDVPDVPAGLWRAVLQPAIP
jgi:glucose/arabinose dehydrogenase